MEELRPSHQSDAGHEKSLDLIEAYAAEVAAAATADRAMAERLRLEIMDHLFEAAADADGGPGYRARHAIERFGSVGQIARDYRTLIVETRGRSLRWIVVTAILVVFAVMKLRGFILEPGWRDDLVSTIWGSALMVIDRYAFVIALLIVLWGMVSERFRSRIFATRWHLGVSAREFGMTAIAAILILLSALAGIGSLVTTTLGEGLSLNGLESITVAALTTICITVLAGLFKFLSAYSKAHGGPPGMADDFHHGAMP